MSPDTTHSNSRGCCAPATAETTPIEGRGSLQDAVAARYGALARTFLTNENPSGPGERTLAPTTCCGPGCGTRSDPVTSGLYSDEEAGSLPEAAFHASLGCGNPTALVELHPGDVVLDLGSGGGIDVLLSARRVGPTGRAIGLDMTEEMVILARRNAEVAGVRNVEFLQGRIDAIPLPADAVDVVVSNCVINLAGDKRRVLAEAFRVLKPGGRLAVSDIVVRGDLPVEVRRDVDALAGCVGGALAEQEFLDLLSEAGFAEPSLEFTRVYSADDVEAMLADTALDAKRISAEVGGRLGSAFVRGTKPRD